MMRILLFLATNFAVMLVLGIILNVTGIAGNSTGGILIMAMLFGFAGSLISLFLSKTMALRSVGAEVITEPRNQAERWLVETVRRQAQPASRCQMSRFIIPMMRMPLLLVQPKTIL